MTLPTTALHAYTESIIYHHSNITMTQQSTVWHKNLTIIKFYGLSILCKLKNLTDHNLMEAQNILTRVQ